MVDTPDEKTKVKILAKLSALSSTPNLTEQSTSKRLISGSKRLGVLQNSLTDEQSSAYGVCMQSMVNSNCFQCLQLTRN